VAGRPQHPHRRAPFYDCPHGPGEAVQYSWTNWFRGSAPLPAETEQFDRHRSHLKMKRTNVNLRDLEPRTTGLAGWMTVALVVLVGLGVAADRVGGFLQEGETDGAIAIANVAQPSSLGAQR
jgi:hypothetical protein